MASTGPSPPTLTPVKASHPTPPADRKDNPPRPDDQDAKLRFFQHFQQQAAQLHAELDAVTTSTATTAPRPDALERCAAGLARLSDDVQQAASYVPAYDQRSYAEAVKLLGARLRAARQAVAPTPRFVFKTRLGAVRDTASGGHGKELERVGTEGGAGRVHPAPPSQRPGVEFADRHDEHITLPASAPHAATTGALTDLQRCVVDLSPPAVAAAALQPADSRPQALASLQMRRIRDSLILAGRVAGPAHITDLQDCVVVVACRQFRMHDCRRVDVYLECGSHPIVEDCDGLRFAPLPRHYKDACASACSDQWDQVDDFNWLKSGPSPHWSIMPEHVRVTQDVWTEVVSGGAGREGILKAAGIK